MRERRQHLRDLDRHHRQSPMASVQRAQITLADHSQYQRVPIAWSKSQHNERRAHADHCMCVFLFLGGGATTTNNKRYRRFCSVCAMVGRCKLATKWQGERNSRNARALLTGLAPVHLNNVIHVHDLCACTVQPWRTTTPSGCEHRHSLAQGWWPLAVKMQFVARGSDQCSRLEWARGVISRRVRRCRS